MSTRLRIALLAAFVPLAHCRQEEMPPPEPESARTGQGAERPSVLLISLDTLRADALGVYGAPGEVTPNLDAFAAAGVRFAAVRAPSPWTLPSHATLFTGLDVAAHGVRGDHDLLSTEIPTLAERFARAGYATGAFTDSGYLHRSFGLLRGFDHIDDLGGGLAAVGARATSWIARQSGPWFAFVHAYDAHSAMSGETPYLAQAEHRERFVPSLPPRLRGDTRLLDRINLGQLRLDTTEREALRALYQASVASADADFGAFWRTLQTRELVSDAVACVVSDHGEGFLEHGLVGHGSALYDEFVRVPWLLTGRGVPAGAVVQVEVDLRDVAETLLEGAMGQGSLEAASLGDGTSRWDAWRVPGGRHPAPLEMDGTDVAWSRRMAESGFDRDLRCLVVFEGPWKLHWFPESGACELYDLSLDPAEALDVAADHPDQVSQLLARARAEFERPAVAAPAHGVAIDALLEALGYSVAPAGGR